MAQDDGLRPLTIAPGTVETTLNLLEEYGRRRCECVVLWLGRRCGSGIHVTEAYRPIQEVRSHMFRITPAGMDELQSRLRAGRLMVAAQVHTHPEEAFHSEADDRWAIIRHEGALSLVLPWFAQRTTEASFFLDAKVYALSSSNEWYELPIREVERCLQTR